MSDAPILHPKTFEEAFPSRFLKAALFDGKQVVLTVKDAYTEELEGDKGDKDEKPKRKLILAFRERPLELVCCKTNAVCMKAMFGSKISDWIGKKISLFPTTTLFAGKTVDCIRIYGSPDIQAPIEIDERIGRKRVKMTLHPLAIGKKSSEERPEAVDPRVHAQWELLGWSKNEGYLDMKTMNLSPEEYLISLNLRVKELDEKN